MCTDTQETPDSVVTASLYRDGFRDWDWFGTNLRFILDQIMLPKDWSYALSTEGKGENKIT